MSGLELLEKLHHDGHSLPAIMITGNADVSMAVQAMGAGALDFIEKHIAVRNSSLASSGLSWKGCSPPTPARTSRPISTSASARSRTKRPDHEENWVEVAARAGPFGASRFGRRRGAVECALKGRDPRVINPREDGQGPRADECDRTRFWLWRESVPKG
jgi:CheY-like chemotaxis protein